MIHAGDFCGGVVGARSVRTISKLTREYLPDTQVLAVLGNHDYWVEGKRIRRNPGVYDHHALFTHNGYPSQFAFDDNYRKIVETFKEHNIHFLDEDGVYRHPDWRGFAFVGHTLWYANPPHSNDAKFLPINLGGDTHRYMYKRSRDKVFENLDQLTDDDLIRIFVSHFPIVKTTLAETEWAGDTRMGEYIQKEYKIDKFLNGHMHKRHEGPVRYEAGSDYSNPNHLIFEV